MSCAVMGQEKPTWPRFVKAALGFTLTAGALTGALDLWTLRVKLLPVPIDHHRGHALAQLFGFLGLFIIGMSLHLAPRFFGAAPPTRAFSLRLWWCAMGGVLLLVVGRLGSLVPGSAWLGLVGAVLLVAAVSAWGSMLLGFALGVGGPLDALQRFLLAGTAWWWLAAVTLAFWQVGQTLGGVTANTPLEVVWSMALYGGATSWLWGLFFRPGIATLGLARPSERRQQAVFWAWQLGVVVQVLGSGLGLAAAALVWWWVLRPFSGRVAKGALQPRALQGGAVFLLLFAGLEVWGAVGGPPLLGDATRHVFTVGVVTLMLFGFAGRMVPGFSGGVLRWAPAYDAGVMAVMLGATLRLAELVTSRVGLGLAGVSGMLTLLGVGLVGVVLIKSLTPPLAVRSNDGRTLLVVR